MAESWRSPRSAGTKAVPRRIRGDDEFDEEFKQQIEELSNDIRLTKKADSIPLETLGEDESNSLDTGGILDEFDDLLSLIEDDDDEHNGEEDTLLTRAKAWMVAYRNWKKFCNSDLTDN